MSDRSTAELDLLREALVVALRTAQRRPTPGDAPPPAALAPFRTFTRFPPKALAVARDALDDDDDYRTRVADVVGDDDTVVGVAGGLFLRRPDGWRDELDALVDARIDDDTAAENRGAKRELERANEVIDQLTERISISDRRERDLRRDLDDARGALDARDRQLAEVRREVSDLTDARGVAVRQLKDVEARLHEAHRQLRELRETDGVASDPGRVDAVEIDEATLRRADRELDALRERLERELRRQHDVTLQAFDDALSTFDAAVGRSSIAEVPSEPPSERAPVRRPLRIGRGIADDSPEAAALLLGRAEMDVLVDGYNVAFAAWPAMSPAEGRELLVARLERLAPITDARVTVVFDGVDRARGTVFGRGSTIRVRFTDAGVEADDEILALIGQIPADRGVTVVSDDRRVVDGARARGANVVRSTTLIELFRR